MIVTDRLVTNTKIDLPDLAGVFTKMLGSTDWQPGITKMQQGLLALAGVDDVLSPPLSSPAAR